MVFVCAAVATAGALEACLADETQLNPQPLPPEDQDKERGVGTGAGSSSGENMPPPAPDLGNDAGADGDAGGE
jgi:hypothetical protein